MEEDFFAGNQHSANQNGGAADFDFDFGEANNNSAPTKTALASKEESK